MIKGGTLEGNNGAVEEGLWKKRVSENLENGIPEKQIWSCSLKNENT